MPNGQQTQVAFPAKPWNRKTSRGLVNGKSPLISELIIDSVMKQHPTNHSSSVGLSPVGSTESACL